MNNGPGNPEQLPYRLGAWVYPDKDPKRYALAHFLSEDVEKKAVFYDPVSPLDQGQTNSCVGHSGRHYERGHPNPAPPKDGEDSPASLDPSAFPAIALYFGAQQDDPWPGGEYPGANPQYEGSSLHGLAKWMQDNGIIQGAYAWANGPSDIHNYLRAGGPVCFASAWTNDMFTPDKDGFIHPTGDVAGGHAYYLFGIDENDNVYMLNSWGTGWGFKSQSFTGAAGEQFTIVGGVAKIAPADLQTLFNDGNAEAFAPVKALAPLPTPNNNLPRVSMNQFQGGGYKKECVITLRGREIAHSTPL